MTELERAALVAKLEQRTRRGESWERCLQRAINTTLPAELADAILADRELYAEFEQQVLDRLTWLEHT